MRTLMGLFHRVKAWHILVLFVVLWFSLIYVLMGNSHIVSAVGFLTIDGDGLSPLPFSTESEMELHYHEISKPEWTALPVVVSGNLKDNILDVDVVALYKSDNMNSEANAYYDVIQSGFQEKFEDLWAEVYDKLNGEFSEINPIVLQEIIEHIHGDDSYGDLIDIATDCLMFIDKINNSGGGEEFNDEASTLYNRFYGWCRTISAKIL